MTEVEAGAVRNLPETLERVLGRRIHAFSNRIQASFYKRTEQPFGISLPEWRVLRSVVFKPGQARADVAADEAIHVMNVSRAVAALRKKGLIEVSPDPADGRRSLLTATPLAEELAADMIRREALMYEHVFSCLDEDERGRLDDLLSRVNEFVRTSELPPPPDGSRDWAAVFSDLD